VADASLDTGGASLFSDKMAGPIPAITQAAPPVAVPTPPAAVQPQATDQQAPDPHRQASDYVERTMRIEGSGRDPNSSAVGGFIDKTWLHLVRNAYPETAQAPDDQVLRLRDDPKLRAQMIAKYGQENAALLQKVGIEASPETLRMAHWFGPAGAVRVLQASPDTPMKDIFSHEVLATNGLEDKTAGDVMKQVRQQMTGADMRGNWTSKLPPEIASAFNYSAQAQDRLRTLEQEFKEKSKEPVAGSASRQQAIDKLRNEIKETTEEWKLRSKHPPVEKPVDMWANFGSPATIVALLGGLFAHRHMTAALSAAGTAMQAINGNNHEHFEKAYKTWELQTNLGLKEIELRNHEIDQLLNDDKTGWDHKLAELKIIADQAGMTEHSAALARGDVTTFAVLQNSLNRGAVETLNAQKGLDEFKRYQDGLSAKLEEWLQSHKGVTHVPAPEMARMQNESWKEAHGGGPGKPQDYVDPTQKDEKGNPIPYTMIPGDPGSAKTLDGQPFKPTGRQKAGTASQAAPDPGLVDYVGKAIAEYRIPPMSGYAMRSQYGQAAMAKAMQLNPEYDASKWAAKVRGEVAFTVGKQADAVRSFGVSIDHLATMEEVGKALENGDVQTLNRLTNLIKREFGYEGPVDFNFAKSIVGGEVSKAIIGQVGALADREEMRTALDTANSPEQLEGVIKTAKKLMAGQLKGYRLQASQFGWTDDEFDKHLSESAKKELAGITNVKYGVGQVIPGKDGKQYRVIGGDLSHDPDIEEIK